MCYLSGLGNYHHNVQKDKDRSQVYNKGRKKHCTTDDPPFLTPLVLDSFRELLTLKNLREDCFPELAQH